MDAFTTHTGTAAPLRRSNVDTDQIIPAEYLKRITRSGFEDGLFKAWRTNEPDFVLNQPQCAGASILVARARTSAPAPPASTPCWALLDGGFRVVISSRFADIFRNNSTKSGLLTVLLPQADVEALWAAVEADPATQVTVDLQAKQVSYGDVDRAVRHRRLHPLAAARGARRRRPHRAEPARHRGVRGAPARLPAEGPPRRLERSPGAGASGSGSRSR